MKIKLSRKKLKFKIKKIVSDIYKQFGTVSAFGVKILDSGKQYVICCKANEPIKKEHARYIGQGKDGHHYWIHKDKTIYIHQRAYPSIWPT